MANGTNWIQLWGLNYLCHIASILACDCLLCWSCLGHICGYIVPQPANVTQVLGSCSIVTHIGCIVVEPTTAFVSHNEIPHTTAPGISQLQFTLLSQSLFFHLHFSPQGVPTRSDHPFIYTFVYLSLVSIVGMFAALILSLCYGPRNWYCGLVLTSVADAISLCRNIYIEISASRGSSFVEVRKGS